MFTTHPEILSWLRTLGYPVEGRSRASLEAMFVREARQWQVPPRVLAALIRNEHLTLEEAGAGAGAPAGSSKRGRSLMAA